MGHISDGLNEGKHRKVRIQVFTAPLSSCLSSPLFVLNNNCKECRRPLSHLHPTSNKGIPPDRD